MHKIPSGLLALLVFAVAVTAASPESSHNSSSASSIKNLKSKIKNVVILEMENRALDNLLGGQNMKGLENPINNGPFCNPTAKDYDSILDDPGHSMTGNNIEFYGKFTPSNEAITRGDLIPTQQGFVHEQLRQYGNDVNRTELATQVLNYYTNPEVPVITTLVHNYLTFNHWHSDVPGPTNPNRACVLSGTSAGHGTDDDAFDSSVHGLKQRSIFQQLSETNHTWKNYYTNTDMIDAYFFDWTFTSNNTHLAQPLKNFHSDAAAGTLPEFSFIDPSCCGQGTNSMHPTGLISDGEAFIKEVYDSLRASPQWNDTLLILTFDETGGFHDHVPPPLATRPDNLTYSEIAPSGEEYIFSFDRLGGRVPTLLISPWVSKGQVEQKGFSSNGEMVSYSASSILRILGYLWDFEPFTPRVRASASFDHLFLSRRRDTPAQMPNPKAFTERS
ncbi:uncharacterized protein N7483_004808 [Penicillium malachiteum]|uniref:uncharacterized protein n=1 Tax=Penicillium malachiteum TaxID=1324776 RepID=UPI0025476402|nr:uncharacterized protein N7483_004808 [Penicillium malachiteum]KAJ5730300.1 hypothetical protein N7483_004808 [Penicillium malachiteum]